MKDYKALAMGLLSESKANINNFFEEKKLIQNDNDFLNNKSFYEQNKDFVLFIKFFGFICQIATIISSYTYFLDVLKSIYIVIPVLLIIELVKYQLLTKIAKSIVNVNEKVYVPFLLVFLVFTAISVVASVLGGGELGNDTSLVTQNETRFKNERNETIKTIDSDIENLKNGISLITKRNSYNGQTWIVGTDKKLIQQKENLLNILTIKKDSLLNELNKQKTLKETEIVSKNETQTKQFKFIFALCDLLFIISTYYVTLFNYKTFLERLEETKAAEKFSSETEKAEIELKETKDAQKHLDEIKKLFKESVEKIREEYKDLDIKSQREKIDALFDELKKEKGLNGFVEENKIGFNIAAKKTSENVLHHGNKICKVCGKAFKYSNLMHKYCSIECKNKFHNNKK